MIAWRQRSPVAVRDVEAEPRWAEVAPALVAAQLRAALSVPVELAEGPIGTLEVYVAGPRDWNDSQVAAFRPMPGWWPACCGPPRPPPSRGAGRAAAVGAPASRPHRAGQGGADGARGVVAGGGLCAAAEHGPHGRPHGRGVGRHHLGRGSLPRHREGRSGVAVVAAAGSRSLPLPAFGQDPAP
jgi:GAF domain